MRIGRRPRALTVAGHAVTLARDGNGVCLLGARDETGLAAGLGFAHAVDRALQLLLVRAVGQGRLAELLDDSDATVAVDVFMRQTGFAAAARDEAAGVDGEARAVAEAYATGVNEALARKGRPLELALLGVPAETWTPADSLLVLKLMSFVGLAQTQLDAEKAIVQAVKAGASLAKLRALFAPHLSGLDEAAAALLRDVRLELPFLPLPVQALSAAPALKASNNWAVAASRSASGSALLASDPHLEVNRLPAVWYEVAARLPGDFRIGVTVPGLPGLVMGRSRHVAASFTYGFMDMVDLFVEEVRGGRYRREDGLRPFMERRETLKRKKHPAVDLLFLENELGVLETRPSSSSPADGLYLVRAFSAHRHGGAETLRSLLALWRARDVPAAQEALEGCAVSANWLLADRGGRIGYQQTGLLPRRAGTGLLPLPAWVAGNRWDGFVPGRELARVLDPPDGVLATANDTWNPPGHLAVNLSMGSDRAERARAFLAARPTLSLDDVAEPQSDLFSRQAERLRALCAPLLPPGPASELLLAWDLRYDATSKGAVVFERLYAALLSAVFGDAFLGREAWQTLASETSLLGYYFHLLDDVLLEGDEALWFGAEGRAGLVARVARESLAGLDPAEVPALGQTRRLSMAHLVLGGRLPAFLGFDRPLTLPGGRASLVQGQVLRAGGRTTTFAPSWRFVTDLAADEARTALAGGPSDRRLSRWYATDVARWASFAHKVVRPPE